MTDAVLEALRSAIGSDGVRHNDAELKLFAHDASNLVGEAGVVCYPRSDDDVCRIIDVCRQFGIPFVARGSGTGLAGGATPIGERSSSAPPR